MPDNITHLEKNPPLLVGIAGFSIDFQSPLK